ncbi:MAG: YybS family protein [Gammaproteobacteria bacterium]|nr:YybS family protein [Gammaproteobacteria bacterium]
MLRGIADFAMKGRWQAAFAAALLSVAAMLLPPLNYLASGVIVLATLRVGPKEGLRVMAATLVVFAIVAGLLLGQVWIAAALLLTSWLPAYLVTLVLGYTRSLERALLAAAGAGILVVLIAHIFLPNPALWWQEMLTPFVQLLSEQSGWQLNAADTQNFLVQMAGMMTGLIAAAVSVNIILGILIGRAWQSALYNEGAFGSEFTQITLGKTLAILTAVLMALSLTPIASSLMLLIDCLPVLLVLFAIQGIAVAHAIVRAKQKSVAWLVVMYVLMVLMLPQMLILTATLGVLEQWFNFRKRALA